MFRVSFSFGGSFVRLNMLARFLERLFKEKSERA